jgi:hypothetical protein
MTNAINNRVCYHVSSSSNAMVTVSIMASPMFAPDDVFIPVTMSTSIADLDKPCKCCGRPIYER